MKLLLSLSMILGLVASANADIVLQDTFNDGNIATNPDIGGGFSQFGATGGSFSETGGALVADTTVNNRRAYIFSTNTFDLSDGFILDYTVNLSNAGCCECEPVSLWVLRQQVQTSKRSLPTEETSWVFPVDFEGFGVDLTTDNGQGLVHNDGDGTFPVLDNAQTIAVDTDLNVVLAVDRVGNYTYSINGAAASTGATTFDLSQEYHFASYYQDNLSSFNISQVTLTAVAVPEPSSTALMGLVGLALLIRRKKN